MKVRYKDFLDDLQNLIKTKITHKQVAEILGVTPDAMRSRYSNDGYLSDDEQEKLSLYFNVDSKDCIQIEHIHIKGSCGSGTLVLDEPDVTPIEIGKNIVTDVFRINRPQDLKVVNATGDSMEPIIEDGDLLLVDIGRKDYSNGGIFLLTINNDYFIKRLRLRVTGELDIISDNAKYPIETLAPNTDVEIKIVGRVFKNLSRGM